MQKLQKATIKQVLVTCYTMSGDKINGAKDSQVVIGPYLFNWGSAAEQDDENYCVWEAARATSAAPTFFPVARVGNGAPNGSPALARWAADGGVAANNPALYALAARQAGPSLTLDGSSLSRWEQAFITRPSRYLTKIRLGTGARFPG
jgi:patatin-like phospholipase/acyl hydrolase